LETLYEKLNNTKAYRQTRLDVAHWVLERPETITSLLDFCFEVDTKISYKAAWILEFVCIERLELLYPHLDSYFENLPKVYRDQALRPLAKICEMLTKAYYKEKNPLALQFLNASHKEQMTSLCFDWLITDQKVAAKVYAMTALYFLGTEYDWIHPELESIIRQHIYDAMPAYKSRGKYVLKQLAKTQGTKRKN